MPPDGRRTCGPVRRVGASTLSGIAAPRTSFAGRLSRGHGQHRPRRLCPVAAGVCWSRGGRVWGGPDQRDVCRPRRACGSLLSRPWSHLTCVSSGPAAGLPRSARSPGEAGLTRQTAWRVAVESLRAPPMRSPGLAASRPRTGARRQDSVLVCYYARTGGCLHRSLRVTDTKTSGGGTDAARRTPHLWPGPPRRRVDPFRDRRAPDLFCGPSFPWPRTAPPAKTVPGGRRCVLVPRGSGVGRPGST